MREWLTHAVDSATMTGKSLMLLRCVRAWKHYTRSMSSFEPEECVRRLRWKACVTA